MHQHMLRSQHHRDLSAKTIRTTTAAKYLAVGVRTLKSCRVRALGAYVQAAASFLAIARSI